MADAKVFLWEDYARLQQLQRQLHNMTKVMTLDEQRDFAEKWRLLMEQAQDFQV